MSKEKLFLSRIDPMPEEVAKCRAAIPVKHLEYMQIEKATDGDTIKILFRKMMNPVQRFLDGHGLMRNPHECGMVVMDANYEIIA